MDKPRGGGGDHQSFVIQVITSSSSSGGSQLPGPQTRVYSPPPPKLKYFSAMKIFDRLRKIVTRFIFPSLPSRGSPPARSVPRQRSGDHRPDPPKTSCSSYYSSSSHYNEAIADCIEFFNKSSQEGLNINCGRESDDMMV